MTRRLFALAIAATLATSADAQTSKKLSAPTIATATSLASGDLLYVLQSSVDKKLPYQTLLSEALADFPDTDLGAVSITGGFWSLDPGVVEQDHIETFGDTPNNGDCLSWGGFGNMLWEPRTKDNVYTLTVGSSSAFTMTDAQTLYFGQAFAENASTTANERRVYIPIDGTITGAHIYGYAGTAGSAEGWILYVRKNNSTDTAIASVAASSQHRTWSSNGLSIAVTAGDYVEIKSVNPTWGTNPAGVRFSGTLVVTR